MRSSKGFSLIELIFIFLVIGIVAAIAVPNLIASRWDTKPLENDVRSGPIGGFLTFFVILSLPKSVIEGV
jgi:hypothetical protein